GFATPNTIDAKLNKAIIFPWKLNCPKSGCNPGIRTDYRSLIIDGVGQLVEVDLATIKGDPVGTGGGGGSPSYTVISGQIKDYSTPIGYKVDLNPGPVDCDQVCKNLNIAPRYSWQLLGTRRKARFWTGVTIDNQDLGCACEREDFSGSNHDNYNGIAVVKGSGKPMIVSATCSNMPLYYKN
ncbi:MAG TPA: hypothetical protein VKR58_00005, partial [Aquella sp.]|nr:hypothetical protein [Aquella sp.]